MKRRYIYAVASATLDLLLQDTVFMIIYNPCISQYMWRCLCSDKVMSYDTGSSTCNSPYSTEKSPMRRICCVALLSMKKQSKILASRDALHRLFNSMWTTDHFVGDLGRVTEP